MSRADANQRPVVGVLACHKLVGPLWSYAIAEKYLIALDRHAGVSALGIPALREQDTSDNLIDRLDGILLPGSVSNIEPHWYGQAPVDDSDPRDPDRDRSAMALIRCAVARGVPLFGICRGAQELNVALGGELHQRVAEVDGLLDHREPPGEDLDVLFAPAHEVQLVSGGLLASESRQLNWQVNSLHGQGVKTLAPPLQAEAFAPDQLIEAFTLKEGGFLLGIQWHPEFNTALSPLNVRIFELFGDACRHYARRRYAGTV
ncbi:gamma-glutamyl-gamma-aminobutyrate hydrolase family protein [Granulosicoccaceae sp. 1_MG-2023]|nr:gamma-glutamyl-gamma-aminobutyrate hydrolase family protein [Granulosicoccaceae sp. 1_MG-2023]